jgi:Protein of unknown function (DUF3099)
VKDARVPRPRRRHQPPTYDVVTPTPNQEHLENIRRRQKRYYRIMVPCIILVAFGFFVPAPTPIRLVALAIAAFMPPIAAIVGNM